MIKGIDISGVQVITNPEALAREGLSFCFVKATEGTGYTNPKLSAQVFIAHKCAMLVGLYHFFHPEMDAKAQANHFINEYKKIKTDLPPVLDLEWGLRDRWTELTLSARIAMVLVWIDMVKKATGKNVILYTNNAFYSQYIDSPGTKVLFGDCLLWLAQYNCPAPKIPQDWITYQFWQYGTDKNIKGINEVDVDIFNGTIEQLKAICA